MSFHLPPATRIHHVHLRVSNLENSVRFYSDWIGLHATENSSGRVGLVPHGGSGPILSLQEEKGAIRKPRGTTGLFHVAFRFEEKRELATVAQRMLDRHFIFLGFADHGVSEALYLADPDGNGIELYVDRPREQWPVQEGELAMMTAPLDMKALLQEARVGPPPEQIKTDIGHVHLQVSDLAPAEQFYCGTLGFDVMQRSFHGALFVSAGGYHHHIGLNTWAGVGAPPPPAHATGLISFTVEVKNLPSEILRSHFESRQTKYRNTRSADGETFILGDPDGTTIEMLLT